MRELLIGYDHGFGRGRSGDASVLQALGQAFDLGGFAAAFGAFEGDEHE